MAGIVYTDYYLPQNFFEIKDVINDMQIPDVEKKEKLDYYKTAEIDKITIWQNEDITAEIIKLIDKMLIQTKININDIGYLAFCNYNIHQISNKVSIPHCIKEYFKMDKATVCMMAENCACTVYSFKLFQAYLEMNPYKYCLIISLSSRNNLTPQERIRGFTVMGDGCAIGLIGSQNCKYEFVYTDTISYGKPSFNNSKEKKITLDGKQISTIAAKIIKRVIENSLVTEIKQVLPQNTNLLHLKVIAMLLRMPIDKIFISNISNGCHIGDVDSLRNITDYVNQNILFSGDTFVVYASGLYETNDIIFATAILKKI